MPDMLVRLYDFEPECKLVEQLLLEGIRIKRALSLEKSKVLGFVSDNFNLSAPGWRDECDVAIGNSPSSCFIACREKEILGFACCECTTKNFFGPTGVREDMRGKGIGKALLHACLSYQKAMGYGYSIIGGTHVAEFYAKACGATVIENSSPGIYYGHVL